MSRLFLFYRYFTRLHPGQQAIIITGMQQQSADFILMQPVDRLAFTNDFKQKARQMNVQSISQVVALSQRILESKPGFTNAWMDELTEYATACGFLALLDDDSRWE